MNKDIRTEIQGGGISMAKIYKVTASNFHGTYSCGQVVANSPQEAKQRAYEEYKNSPLGRALNDAGAFRFSAAAIEGE